MVRDTMARLRQALPRRFTIQRELGRGRVAFVFLARDHKHHRSVALKVLRPEVALVLGRDRFLGEIDLVAQLQHPHIVPVYDSYEAEGFLFYVMPYIDGVSLRVRLSEEGRLDTGEALELACQVADGLAYAHTHNVVHRDIKPENILLHGSSAVITDFGLARLLIRSVDRCITPPGIAVGTPAYMSPEQCAGSDDVDARSDVYALGCVIYEMLAGQPPFTGSSAEVIRRRHQVDPPPLTLLRTHLSPELLQTVNTALAKSPAERYATCTEPCEALMSSLYVERRNAYSRSDPPAKASQSS